MKNKLMDAILPLLPKSELSHAVGRLVHRPLPGLLGRKSVEWFCRYFSIDMDEAEKPLSQYTTIGDLFTRRLKSGVRPIGPGVVHPADSLVTEAGRIDQLKLLQAKGRFYSVPELLGSERFSSVFENGHFLTYYLCPTDYHRVHSPVGGDVVWSCHVPGELWPVNDWSVRSIPHLFATNERVSTVIDTQAGKVALVMVAATNVGDIRMCYDSSLTSGDRRGRRMVKERRYDPPHSINKGDEIGVFHMGSTVVMLYQEGILPADPQVWRGTKVRMGESVFPRHESW